MMSEGKNKIEVVDETTIKLFLNGERGKGRFTLLDKDDLDLVKSYSWSLFTNTENSFYTVAWSAVKPHHMSMHRLIMNPDKGVDIDHVNGDGLDNRRSNLRLCTKTQNSQNRRRLAPRKSPYIGVYKKEGGDNWGFTAVITVDGKKKALGTFPTAEEAAKIRDSAAKYYFKEFASLNFPDEIDDLPEFDPSKVILMKRGSTSKYKGVYKRKAGGKWCSFVIEDKKDIHLGTFNSEIEAHNARINYLNNKEKECTSN